MSDDKKLWPRHSTGKNDNVLITMAAHHVSFETQWFGGKVFVTFGPDCGVQLTVAQARDLRALLDAAITDAESDLTDRVSLLKAVA